MPSGICDGSWDAVADRLLDLCLECGWPWMGYKVKEEFGRWATSGSLTTTHGAELVSTPIDRGRRSEPRFRVTSLNRSEKQQLLTLTSTHSLPN
jgi:hypothetical protein